MRSRARLSLTLSFVVLACGGPDPAVVGSERLGEDAAAQSPAPRAAIQLAIVHACLRKAEGGACSVSVGGRSFTGICTALPLDAGLACLDAPDACPVCPAVCGDRVVEGQEQCDEAGNTAACDVDCTAATCGDGYVNPAAGEACDDGNVVDGDGCGTSCQLETVECPTCPTCSACGNGIKEGTEACDTAGPSATCDADCTAPVCGDSFVNPQAGEACDDGNVFDDDSCASTCQFACGGT